MYTDAINLRKEIDIKRYVVKTYEDTKYLYQNSFSQMGIGLEKEDSLKIGKTFGNFSKAIKIPF